MRFGSRAAVRDRRHDGTPAQDPDRIDELKARRAARLVDGIIKANLEVS